jgi:hypothetical protein
MHRRHARSVAHADVERSDARDMARRLNQLRERRRHGLEREDRRRRKRRGESERCLADVSADVEDSADRLTGRQAREIALQIDAEAIDADRVDADAPENGFDEFVMSRMCV